MGSNPMEPNRRWLLDTIERTARTFVQGFLAVATADQFTSLDTSTLQTFEVALIAGGFAVMTAFAAKGFGSTASASVVPAVQVLDRAPMRAER